MVNSLDPDQARHFVGPGMGPNSLQRLSADDDTSRQRVNIMFYNIKINLGPSSEQTLIGTYPLHYIPRPKVIGEEIFLIVLPKMAHSSHFWSCGMDNIVVL